MQTVLTLLLICSLTTGLVTEALKKMIPLPDDAYSKNILAGVVSAIVGVAVSAGYVILSHTQVTSETIIYVLILIILSWLTAMLGYDKVVQTITQMTRKSNAE